MLYHLLIPFQDAISALRVFKYITFRTAAAALTAMFVCFLLGPYLIRLLQKKQLGQVVRDDGPESHLKKAGTPTMGGLLILIATISAALLWARLDQVYIWLVMLAFIGMGGIGFLDDMIKIRKNKGISARQKFLLQVIVTLLISSILFMGDNVPSMPSFKNFDTEIYLPFLKNVTPEMGALFLIWMVLVVVGSSNAVNLTDGLDGLAIGPVITASVTFLLFAYITGNVKFANYLNVAYIANVGELAIFCGALFGAGLGFLWYNTYPAQVFMGDVGSLGIGGALGMIAILVKQEILWILVGGIFVMETLSVIIQVVSFKLTGKRVFRMAPIHHHFELKGWAEPKVIVRFWIISIILSLLALSSLKLR